MQRFCKPQFDTFKNAFVLLFFDINYRYRTGIIAQEDVAQPGGNNGGSFDTIWPITYQPMGNKIMPLELDAIAVDKGCEHSNFTMVSSFSVLIITSIPYIPCIS